VVGVVTCNLKQSKKKPRARSAKLQVDGSRTGNMGVMGGTWVPASRRPPTANSAPSSAIGGQLRAWVASVLLSAAPVPGLGARLYASACPVQAIHLGLGQGLPYHSPVWPVTSPRPILRSHSFFPSLLFRGRTSPPNPSAAIRVSRQVSSAKAESGKVEEKVIARWDLSTTINQSINHPARISSFDQPNK
jgi:hypothetical protein